MKTSLYELSKELDFYKPKLFISQEHTSSVHAAKILLDNQTTFDAEVLYVGTLSSLLCVPRYGPINCLCTTENFDSNAFSIPENTNCLLLGTQKSISNVFNEIQDILLENNRLQEDSLELMNLLATGNSIQHIIDTASEIFGNPILIYDIGLKILGYTQNIAVDDPVWIDHIKGEIKGSKVLNNHYSLTDIIKKSKEPVLTKFNVSKLNRMFAKVVDVKNETVAFATLLDYQRPFRRTDKKLMQNLCLVISLTMQKKQFAQIFTGDMVEELIKDLLNEKLENNESLSEKIKQLKIASENGFYILAVDIKSLSKNELALIYVRDELENLLKNSKSVVYNNGIVLLVRLEKDNAINAHDLENVRRYANEKQLRLGISRVFTDITSIKKYYRQAVKAMELGVRLNREKVLFIYEEHAVYHFISTSQCKDIKEYINPSLLKLQEYDAKNNTDYYKSLYSYLMNGKNLSKASDDLHVHRNTLSYRMSKIEGLIDINWDNGELLHNLYHSYKIIECIEKL